MASGGMEEGPSQDDWLPRLAILNVYRAKGGPAPHKTLLLRNLRDQFEELAPDGRTLTLSPPLAYRFGVFWTIGSHRRTQPANVRRPNVEAHRPAPKRLRWRRRKSQRWPGMDQIDHDRRVLAWSPPAC